MIGNSNIEGFIFQLSEKKKSEGERILAETHKKLKRIGCMRRGCSFILAFEIA